MLTSQPDNKNVWIRHNDHIPCSSSSICHCLRLRLRCSLVLRQAPRIYLAHCHTDHNLCRGLQHPHQHPQCRSAVFWNHPANQRYVQRINLQLSWETTVVPSPRAKKAALIAIANCISQSSHWFSPYFYPTSQEPFYRMGGGLVLMGCALVALSVFAVNWRGRRLNKRLDETEGWSPQSGNERGWRYKL